jgi:hypothetical protein
MDREIAVGSHLGEVWVPSTANASSSKFLGSAPGDNQLAMGALFVRLQISARQNSIFLSADIGPPRNYA